MLDYKLIEAMAMVVREGGFDKAADALHITQSAVSQRVKLLEEYTQFQTEFVDREVDSISPDEILPFLTKLTDGNKPTTKRNRYSSLKAFFNFIKNSTDSNIQNPCDTPILRKIFKDRKLPPWPIVEKELIDEIIFKTTNPRNRIMLELMARDGNRIKTQYYDIVDCFTRFNKSV